jgi:hypothetical protein
VLEIAVLGLLNESPMHGYEFAQAPVHAPRHVPGILLRVALSDAAQAVRGRLDQRGFPGGGPAEADLPAWQARLPVDRGGARSTSRPCSNTSARTLSTRRASARGWRSFAHTRSDIRLRILEGRRRRVEEQRDGIVDSLASRREKWDSYTLQLQEHGLESVNREVRWLTELIDNERSAGTNPVGRLTHSPKPTHDPRRIDGFAQHRK